MVNPSTESILNQMTNLAMDIAMDYGGDYVLPASPMSDVCKTDLFEFEREVVRSFNGGKSDAEDIIECLAGSLGTVRGCSGRPPTSLCKKKSYMGAAGCDSCSACLARNATAEFSNGSVNGGSISSASSPSSSSSPASSECSTPSGSQPATAETTMDISWCQFEGCEFDTTDNSYLDICDWIFYADRYSLTEENREKVQKAFQMVPPGEVTGYVAEPPQKLHQKTTPKSLLATSSFGKGDIPIPSIAVDDIVSQIKKEIKCESDDDYLWTSDNHLQPIILKAEPNADIQQITELDHSYLQTPVCSSAASSTVVSPVKHHHPSHLNVDLLGLVTPPPSRSQSSEEEEIDVVNDVDSWDAPTMADIMKRGIVKKHDPPVTKFKNTVKRKYNRTANSSTYPAMPPPPPKKLCGGLSLMDRFKKDTNWKDVPAAIPIKQEPIKDEPLDDDTYVAAHNFGLAGCFTVKPEVKSEPSDDEDDEYDMDADFESLMKNEPDELFDEEYDDCDDENDVDWDKVFRSGSSSTDSSMRGGRYGKPSYSCSGGGGNSSSSSSSGGGSSSSSSSSTGAGRKKKKKKKKAAKSSSKHNQQQQQQQQQQQSSGVGKKIKYEGGGGGSYSYKTKLMDPVKRALHNDLEKSRRVETSMLFMNLSMQVSFLDDNRKIPSKLSILRGAKRECDLMMLDERRLVSEKHAMQQKQRMLRERLFELRREQYHRRYGKNTTNHSKQQQQQQQQQY